MAQLSVPLSETQLTALRAYAAERRTEVDVLMLHYVEYLLAGGTPIVDDDAPPTAAELAAIAASGGAFDWLADEPDLYSLADGEPV